MIFVRENTEDVYKGLEFAIGQTPPFACESSHAKTANASPKKPLKSHAYATAKRKSPPSTKQTSCESPTAYSPASAAKSPNTIPTSRLTNSTLTQHRCD